MKKLFVAVLSVFAVLTLLISPAEAKVKHISFLHMKHATHLKHGHNANFLRKNKLRAPALPPIVVAKIDISSQTMAVTVNGWPAEYWNVSTARPGYHTPRGTYGVTRLAKVYFSRKYDNSPMPNSVFFHGGFAIHGTGHISGLGHPASHGCVRVHPNNALAFYNLVEKYGPKRTRIILTD